MLADVVAVVDAVAELVDVLGDAVEVEVVDPEFENESAMVVDVDSSLAMVVDVVDASGASGVTDGSVTVPDSRCCASCSL